MQLKRPENRGRLSVTTDAQGQFSFTGIGPGRYEVELPLFERVIASSGPVELSERAMVVSGVTVSQQRTPMSRGKKIAIGVAIGVAVFVVIGLVYSDSY